MCCTSVLNFHSKNLQITSKLLTQGYRNHKLRKTFGKFFISYSELLSKFGDILFQEYLSKGISQPVFYGDLVYKLKSVKDTPNFFSSGSKIVKRLRRRQYDPVIIERTIGLVLDLHRIMSGFHGAFATGVASQQGTLTLPDTWFRPPFWDLLMLQLLRPNSSNLPCLYSTFHLEYPLVLSRFCPWPFYSLVRTFPKALHSD